MRFVITFLLFLCFLSACDQTSTTAKNQEEKKILLNQDLILELSQMVKEDQNIQYSTVDKSEKVKDSLHQQKNFIFEKNGKRAMQIFEKFGFPGFNVVGEKGSNNFWIIIQHYDQNVPFQEKILEQMKIEVNKGNASNKKYAYLVDRVFKNKGEKQLYGTQVQYLDDFWLAPRPLQDSLNVNQRRTKIGMESIEKYLNLTMQVHFEMNKTVYEKAGLTGPRMYK